MKIETSKFWLWILGKWNTQLNFHNSNIRNITHINALFGCWETLNGNKRQRKLKPQNSPSGFQENETAQQLSFLTFTYPQILGNQIESMPNTCTVPEEVEYKTTAPTCTGWRQREWLKQRRFWLGKVLMKGIKLYSQHDINKKNKNKSSHTQNNIYVIWQFTYVIPGISLLLGNNTIV